MNGPFSRGIFPVLDDLINKLFWNRIFVINGYNHNKLFPRRNEVPVTSKSCDVRTPCVCLFCRHETDHLAVLATRDQTFLLALRPLGP